MFDAQPAVAASRPSESCVPPGLEDEGTAYLALKRQALLLCPFGAGKITAADVLTV